MQLPGQTGGKGRREPIFIAVFAARHGRVTRTRDADGITTARGENAVVNAEIVPPDFESRLRLGLSELLTEHPELRDALPLAAMMDDAIRWCA